MPASRSSGAGSRESQPATSPWPSWLTEPAVGSDAANLTASARRDGDEWVVSGEKASITFAGFADACIVFARTGGPGARGISMILVPLDALGVSRQVYHSAGGHLSQRGSLFFDEVRVPLDHQVGAEGAGFIGAMEAFDFNRAVIALACIGSALQSLDETIEFTKRRMTFGQPLAKREGVAFQIAEHLALGGVFMGHVEAEGTHRDFGAQVDRVV